jgi:hypothetical protein
MPFMSVHSPPRLALHEILYHLIWRFRAWSIGSPAQAQWQAQQGIRTYADLAARLRRDGCEVAMEVLPPREEGLGIAAGSAETTLLDDLTAAMAREGVAVGYPAGLFRGGGTADSLYHDRWHLDRRGHGIYAQYLANRFTSGLASLHSRRDPATP